MFLSARRTNFMLRSSRWLGRTTMESRRRHVAVTSVSFSTNPAVTTVALLRETYDPWERRAPLTPLHVEQLVQQHHQHNNNIRFLVQPSGRRIFPDQAYAQAGAIIQDDVSTADILLGVKRPVDSSTLIPDKTYMFFSHTIKGQAENMGLLRDVLDKRIQLMDYECLREHQQQQQQQQQQEQQEPASTSTKKTKRLVSFGRFAGMAGMVDTFHALGRRLLYRDDCSNTPFLSCPSSIMHDTVEQAKDRVLWMGERIFYEGLPGENQEPLVFTVTGKGGCVHDGVMEILQLLPHELLSVSDLPHVVMGGGGTATTTETPQHQIYILPVGISDVFEKVSSSSGHALPFCRADFAEHPQDYRSVFCERVAPYTQVLMNCIYWDARFPRLLTKQGMKRLAEEGKDRYVDKIVVVSLGVLLLM
jgi:alpha-aminoadipic semialdehyde synthase